MSRRSKATRAIKQTYLRVERHAATILLLVIAFICLAIGASMLLDRYRYTHNPTIPNAHQTVQSDANHPSEAKPSKKQVDSYVVPADQPRSIIIPSVHIDGLIQRVGLTPDNAVATPGSIFFGGWFVNSAKPGDKGLSIIDGHVSGWYSDGIFKYLIDVKPGAAISVEYGDKSMRKFVVVSVQSVPESKAAALLFERRSDIKAQLNLITCGGKFDTKTNLYENRVIVVAKRIS